MLVALPVGIKNLNSPEPGGSAFDLGAFENRRAYPEGTSFSVFGVVTPNACAGDGSGAIRLYIANSIEPLKYNWTGPSGFLMPAKI